jgi:hypothetical protein
MISNRTDTWDIPIQNHSTTSSDKVTVLEHLSSSGTYQAIFWPLINGISYYMDPDRVPNIRLV